MNKPKLSTRQRIIAAMVILIVLQWIVVSMLFVKNNMDRTIDTAEAQLKESVLKNRLLTDGSLNAIMQKVKSLNVDTSLFEFLETVHESGYTAMSTYLINSINNRYFWDTSDFVVSVNLTSSAYSSTYANFYIPYANLLKQIPNVKSLPPEFLWYPNEILEDWGRFGNELKESKTKTNVFMLVRRLTPSIVKNGSVVVADRAIERPVLVVSFLPALYDAYFSSGIPYLSGGFAVTTAQGVRVAGDELLSTAPDEPWMLDALAHKEGSGIYTIGDREVIVCYSTSMVNGWIMALYTPVDELNSQAYSYFMFTWIFILFNALVVILCMYIVTRSATKPYDELAGWARSITTPGDLSKRMNIGGGQEVVDISQTINQLNDWLNDMMQKNSEIAKQEQEASIAALEMQLNPHFLYNTLNIINMIAIEQEQKEISMLIVNLSGMMQYTIHKRSKFSNAHEEFVFLDRYIYLMRARFPGKFTVTYDLSAEVHDAVVPKMLLQPFVENAILHGFTDMTTGGEITIRGYAVGKTLTFEIQDNGKGLTNESWHTILEGKEGHIGCSNVNKRLKLIFGEDYGLSVISRSAPTIVEIRFPLISGGNGEDTSVP